MAEGIWMALHPGALVAALAGTLLGIIFGAIPGLSATLGIALLLPVTFLLQPDQGLIMLGGVYAGAIYGGSISAVLVNIPGTAAAAVTAIEGHAMAREGKAPLALGLSATASGIGGLASAFALLWLSPLLAQLALRFGPAEYVALVAFSLVIVAVMLPTPLLGNAAGALLGLAISTIGLDPFDGTPRFTFGRHELAGGLPLLPLLIGSFAMPQVLIMAVETLRGQNRLEVDFASGSDHRAVARETFRHGGCLARTTLIGIFLGIMPAIGPESTPITAHAMERRFAREPDRFGRGSSHGLIAAECSNNANVGGSLIPLLALGIPGSAAAAVFLGALEIHGLRAGPLLFAEHPAVLSSFFTGFVIVNLMVLLLGLFAARYLAAVLMVPKSVIATAVALSAMFGGLAAGNTTFYIWVLLAATVFALGLRVLLIPIVPVVLGFLLGDLFEQQLAILITSTPSWAALLDRPIALGIAAVTLALIGWAGWQRGLD